MPGSPRRAFQAVAICGALAICLLSPSFAAATTVPPGATEGDQYFEEVPNGGGSSSVNSNGGGGAGAGGGQAVAATQALDTMGTDGKAAANLANSNKPPTAGSDGKGSTAQPASSTEGEGGMGAWFPIILVITALGAVAYGVRRRLNPA